MPDEDEVHEAVRDIHRTEGSVRYRRRRRDGGMLPTPLDAEAEGGRAPFTVGQMIAVVLLVGAAFAWVVFAAVSVGGR